MLAFGQTSVRKVFIARSLLVLVVMDEASLPPASDRSLRSEGFRNITRPSMQMDSALGIQPALPKVLIWRNPSWPSRTPTWHEKSTAVAMDWKMKGAEITCRHLTRSRFGLLSPEKRNRVCRAVSTNAGRSRMISRARMLAGASHRVVLGALSHCMSVQITASNAS